MHKGGPEVIPCGAFRALAAPATHTHTHKRRATCLDAHPCLAMVVLALAGIVVLFHQGARGLVACAVVKVEVVVKIQIGKCRS